MGKGKKDDKRGERKEGKRGDEKMKRVEKESERGRGLGERVRRGRQGKGRDGKGRGGREGKIDLKGASVFGRLYRKSGEARRTVCIGAFTAIRGHGSLLLAVHAYCMNVYSTQSTPLRSQRERLHHSSLA